MNEPLQGQGDPPEADTQVYINVYLDRLLTVDDKNFEFKAIFDVTLNWRDPRAIGLISNRTEQVRAGSSECQRVCGGPPHGRSSWQPCCDTIWLPDMMAGNVEELPEGRIDQESIIVMGTDMDVVQWTVRVEGLFYTPMNFRDFPFDDQALGVKFTLGIHDAMRTELVESSSGFRDPNALIIDNGQVTNELDGWRIDSVEVRVFETMPMAASISKYTQYSHGGDPGASTLADPAKSTLRFDQDSGLITLETTRSQGFYIFITVSRVWYMHFLNLVLPVILCMWLALAIFFINPKDIETRLGTVVTLFLALVAVQFVANDQQPSSQELIATQQLVILTFFSLSIICVITIVSFRIATVQDRYNMYEAYLSADNAAIDNLAKIGVKGIKTSIPIGLGPRLGIQSRLQSRYSIPRNAQSVPPSTPQRDTGSVHRISNSSGALDHSGAVQRTSGSSTPVSLQSRDNPVFQTTFPEPDNDCAVSMQASQPAATSEEEDQNAMEVKSTASIYMNEACCFSGMFRCNARDGFRERIDKVGSILRHLPRNIRKVENYGGYVAWQLDKASFWILLITYHIGVILIFLLNDFFH